MPATLASLFISARRLQRKQHIWMTDTGIRGTEDILTQITPYRGMKIVAFSFTVPGLTQYEVTRTGRKIGPIPHREIIAFQDCNILEANSAPSDEEKNKYFQINYKGDIYWIEKINLDKQKATIRCDCRDFIYTWAYYDFRTGNLWGPPPKPYIRKTPAPPVGRPYRNPNGYPGFCKHIYYIWRNFMVNQRGKEFFS